MGRIIAALEEFDRTELRARVDPLVGPASMHCAIIQGGDEKLKNEVQIKDLILGGGLTAIKDRDEYLKKQAEAQFAVPVDNLVEAVNRVLTRHGIVWT